MNGVKRNLYRIFAGKPGKVPLGSSKHRWVDIKMDLRQD
jgi:hypothetical protein